MNEGLKINTSTILENSKEVKCPNPDCDSKLFFPTIKVNEVSGLITGTGKPGVYTISGPLLCVKCHRELVDADFGYKDEVKEESSDIDDTQSTG